VPSSKKRELKVVLDANVWVSALLWGGKPAEVIKAAEHGKARLLVSEEIVREISRVLNYPKLRKVYEAEGLAHEELIEAVLKIVKFVTVTRRVKVVVGHPADDKFIQCALEAKADYIVSGDKHLLGVGVYRKIPMVSVNEFLKILEKR
jgi:putative PIN family toxin of toxin-antitoxin system